MSEALVLDNGWREANRSHDHWLAEALDSAHNRARLAGWQRVEFGQDGACYKREGIGLGANKPPMQTVIISGSYRDDIPWLHVSTAWSNRLPTWDEFRQIRDVFLDDGLIAVQVFPPKAEYINQHPYCLHLYARVDARTVPDLRIIGTI